MSFDDIKKLLGMLDDPAMRLEAVMDLGNNLGPIPTDAVCSEITGCTSFVQICRNGNKFYGSADSAIVRGIVAIILAMVDGKDIQEIKKMDLIGEFNALDLNFGASRLNGIQSIVSFFKNL